MRLHPIGSWKSAIAVVLLLGLSPAQADGPRHGLSAFGDLKYPGRFQAFRLGQPRCAQGRPAGT